MWQYRSTNELYHHGVIGMKWHNHKTKVVNRAIDMHETARKNNKNSYDNMTRNAKSRYGNKPKRLNKINARNKALYDSTEVDNKYGIAKQKARLDKNYKNSKEYKKAKKDFNKKMVDNILYGPNGHVSIEALKNQGYSEKQAKGRLAITELLGVAAVGSAATMGFLKYS